MDRSRILGNIILEKPATPLSKKEKFDCKTNPRRVMILHQCSTGDSVEISRRLITKEIGMGIMEFYKRRYPRPIKREMDSIESGHRLAAISSYTRRTGVDVNISKYIVTLLVVEDIMEGFK